MLWDFLADYLISELYGQMNDGIIKCVGISMKMGPNIIQLEGNMDLMDMNMFSQVQR